MIRNVRRPVIAVEGDELSTFHPAAVEKMIENNRVRSRSETIECSLLIGFRRCIACRSHQSGQRLEMRIVNGCIKVSAQDNRRFLTGNLSNLRHDQFHALLTGNFPLVVEVSVEIEKLFVMNENIINSIQIKKSNK